MTHQLDRRLLLQSVTALGAAALTGLTAGRSYAQPQAQLDGDFPPVPGMRGDRRANEMWYHLDEVTLFNRTPEVEQAYAELYEVFGDGFMQLLFDTWSRLSGTPDYETEFTEFVTPIRAALQAFSRVQLEILDLYYLPNDPRLVTAFGSFGQGILFDPRRAGVGPQVHMMDGEETMSYHLWHIFLRAMMMLDIDRARWARLDPLIGYAWALQSLALPDSNAINPPLPRETVRGLAGSWLPRSPAELDRSFRSFPYPTD
ncbi:hypothetical protein [Actinoalloteichus hymeniacidonis]|uniref:Uncharacterized protein n=1 Tax=Actinoalloteichus hymeniacidonis TaxID=340345 RepID=A0AAC9HNI3_9PSEU|nr:hypothetical protein [Actinoalloteichus hymeniacidonis]AOS62363.1 hypothetical protein TL08_07725 [Actinoalloteichus hymeniacidonis]MBB5909609.1 hypothetical protein [Actinoalloteichus hymeniacidonis]